MDQREENKGVEKQKYEKPAIVYSEKIETRAGTCTPAPPGKTTTPACSGPLTS